MSKQIHQHFCLGTIVVIIIAIVVIRNIEFCVGSWLSWLSEELISPRAPKHDKYHSGNLRILFISSPLRRDKYRSDNPRTLLISPLLSLTHPLSLPYLSSSLPLFIFFIFKKNIP